MAMDRAIPGLRSDSRRRKVLRNRELGFDNSSQVAPLPDYRPLEDVHLRHLWLNPRTRSVLQSVGFIDEDGHVIDVDAHRRKLHVIEQELAQADCVERDRAREKERRLRDRQTLARRQEVFERHLKSVGVIREREKAERDKRRAALLLRDPSTAAQQAHTLFPGEGGGPGTPLRD
eukprot:TRINITY_DN95004_c0_g1_i1.p2 TRINITY_DN95004_c0_g1~~TRINITY_DN95004_c0_g1_i1.p2  ORF type:complete len:175 (-),score=50.86 TRINITY_DN95004_c0_g1_i1:82-606(-)